MYLYNTFIFLQTTSNDLINKEGALILVVAVVALIFLLKAFTD